MTLFGTLKRRSSAPVARERLQVLLAYERTVRGGVDLLAILKEEILAVVARHTTIEADNVRVKMDRGNIVSTLEIDIEIPNASDLPLAAGA